MLLERLVVGAAAVALAAVMVVGAADILLGELFGLRLAFKVDMSGTLMAAAVFLAWPLLQRRDEHIAVDLFTPFLPRWSDGARWLMAQLAALVVFALIARGAWMQALASIAIWERSAATLGYPIWPAKLACAVGASLVLLVILHALGLALWRRLAPSQRSDRAERWE
jgi:TRAP-type C4-dicarboxylate transport system permease small subunit